MIAELTIFGSVYFFIVCIYIIDMFLYLFFGYENTIDYNTYDYKLIGKLYNYTFVTTVLFSILYSVVSAWMQLSLGYTTGLIFKTLAICP